MKRLLGFFLLFFLIIACNPHGDSEIDSGASLTPETPDPVYQEQTFTFDLSDSSAFTFTASDVTMSGSQAALNTVYTLIDDFSDDTNTDWTILNMGSTPVLNETGGELTFECDSNWGGAQNIPAGTYSDYIAYNESTVTAWETGTQVIAILARVQDQNNLYMAGTWSGNHYIYRRVGGSWNLITSTGGFTPSAGVTYAMKFEVDGTNLSYKIWDTSGAEPGAYLVSGTDANYASGDIGIACYRDNGGAWDNVRAYPAGATTDYPTTDPTLVFPEVTTNFPVQSWDSLSVTTNVTGNDDIKYDISLDGGTTFVSYQGGQWTSNGTGYANANTLTEINSNLSSLDNSGQSFILRAYIHSDAGDSTPSISAASLTFTEIQ